MNEHIALVKKWLNDPDSVSQKELKDNDDAAHASATEAAWAAAAAHAVEFAEAADYCVKRYEELINE
tara:strand:- start:34 stop:234 length:201 start_codon:yes stop_codon:yes gene_type:complete